MKPGLYCAICNHYEKYNLQYHLKELHGLTTKQYRQMYPKNKVMTGHSKRTLEYWVYKGFSVEEALHNIKEFQKTGKKRFLEKRAQEGKPAEVAQREWNKKQAKNSIRSTEYYTSRGFNLTEAVEKVAQQQSRYSALSKKFTGKKHTESAKRAISKKIKDIIEEEGVLNRIANFYKNRSGIRSGGEVQCYLELKQHFADLSANVEIGGKVVDMLIGNLAIEYYGDFWHRNPKKYTADYYARGLLTEKVWERDSRRLEHLKECGYRVFVIWEDDWLRDSDIVIKRIKQLIHESN